jgi:hypothetical protein
LKTTRRHEYQQKRVNWRFFKIESYVHRRTDGCFFLADLLSIFLLSFDIFSVLAVVVLLSFMCAFSFSFFDQAWRMEIWGFIMPVVHRLPSASSA